MLKPDQQIDEKAAVLADTAADHAAMPHPKAMPDEIRRLRMVIKNALDQLNSENRARRKVLAAKIILEFEIPGEAYTPDLNSLTTQDLIPLLFEAMQAVQLLTLAQAHDGGVKSDLMLRLKFATLAVTDII